VEEEGVLLLCEGLVVVVVGLVVVGLVVVGLVVVVGGVAVAVTS
jgi:hypothetical protein